MKKALSILLALAATLPAFTQDQPEAGENARVPLSPPPVYAAAAPEHGFTAPIATSSPEAQECVLRGLSHLISLWDEAAYLEFKRALSLDPDCAMAHWGLVISTITPGDERSKEKEASLEQLQIILASENAPERELAYIRALYMLLRDGPRTAANDFEAIATKWKGDQFATLFTAVLCRDGFDEEGNPREGQQRAVRILDNMLVRQDNLQPAHFLRALIEETNPKRSPDTLDNAFKAAELSPGHAPSQHLIGHYFFRSGQYAEAEAHFTRAAELYVAWQNESHVTYADNEGYFRSLAYRAVAEFCRGDLDAARATSEALAAIPVNLGRPKAKGTQIQLWEAHNLPLKLALSTNPPSDRTQVEAAIPKALDTTDDLLSNSVTAICTQYGSLLLAGQDGNKTALDVHMGNLDRLGGMLAKASERAERELSVSYWVRALELCEQYLLQGKAMMFTSSADTWHDEAARKQKFASLLLPPVLPYPAEWPAALRHLKQEQYDECIRYCDAGLERFPDHAGVMATRQEALARMPKAAPPVDAAAEEDHPFLDPSFEVAWSKLTPERIKPDITTAIERAERRIDAICALADDELTYDNTFAALEEARDIVGIGWSRIMHLDSVMNNPAQRSAIAEVMPDVVRFTSAIPLNARLWHVIKTASAQPWVEGLSPDKRRYVEETLAEFKESGADLPDDQKERFAENAKELSMVTKWFAENVLDSINAWELIVMDPGMLKGLPETEQEAARISAREKGHGTDKEPNWRFTLQAPSSGPVMKFAESEQLRRLLWEAGSTIGSGEKDNAPLIETILRLRQEKADMLGYKSFADYTTARRMAKTGQNALDFINGLHDRVLPHYRREMEELLNYRNEKTGEVAAMLKPWEVEYWKEKRRQELYEFDEEELRPYFPINAVMQGMFDIFSRLYNVRVEEKQAVYLKNGRKRTAKEKDAVEVWHPEVRFYEIYDNATGEHLGSFYTDWHPRESKRRGAWMNCLRSGLPPMDGNPRIPHLGLMCGNMTKPVGNKEALINHREVKTLFHEYGHLLHQLLCDVEVKALSGTKVAWDFVELPSQINENWIWERGGVDIYAKHFKTGEKIPAPLYDKMIAARNYMSATGFMQQLTLGKLDLELHVNYAKYAGRNLEEIDEEILADYRIPMTDKGLSVARGMTHLFSSPVGYGAGYYSYKWAEVLEADAFSRFRTEGILNPQTGKAFRTSILSRGNSKPAAELYRDFMGRDPDPTPLLIKFGIPVE